MLLRFYLTDIVLPAVIVIFTVVMIRFTVIATPVLVVVVVVVTTVTATVVVVITITAVVGPSTLKRIAFPILVLR